MDGWGTDIRAPMECHIAPDVVAGSWPEMQRREEFERFRIYLGIAGCALQDDVGDRAIRPDRHKKAARFEALSGERFKDARFWQRREAGRQWAVRYEFCRWGGQLSFFRLPRTRNRDRPEWLRRIASQRRYFWQWIKGGFIHLVNRSVAGNRQLFGAGNSPARREDRRIVGL